VTGADRYLQSIYLLQRSTDEPAATGAVADTMGVSPASANEMVGKLEDAGLATHEKYVGVTLTDEGIERARAALETYCVIERFLATALEVEEYRAEARQMQPVVDEVVAERLDLIVDRREECPDCFRVDEDRCAHLTAPDDGPV
jgi:Mn-dependent DtxR family transcriptional regulator